MRIFLPLFLFFATLNVCGQELKLLPIEIKTDRTTTQYTYDDQNRFTSLMEMMPGDTIRYMKYLYVGDTMEVRAYDDKGEYDSVYMLHTEVEKNIYHVTFYETGKADTTAIVMKFNDAQKLIYISFLDDNNFIVHQFVYDDSNNLIDVDLPDNVPMEYINSVFQTVCTSKMIYDNQNGIFKNVHPVYSVIHFIYQFSLFAPILYTSNNMIYFIDKEDEPDPEFEPYAEYNEHNYPTTLGNTRITYMEAKQQ